MRKRFNVDCVTLNQRVQGSIPCAPTKKIRYLAKAIQIASDCGVTSGVTIRRALSSRPKPRDLHLLGEYGGGGKAPDQPLACLVH